MSAPASPKPVALPPWPELLEYEYSSKDPSKTLPIYNPATGELITTLRVGDPSTVEAAVARGKAAFELWSRTPAMQRGALMAKAAEVVMAHADELGTILCLENGKPFLDGRNGDINAAATLLRFFGSLADKIPTEFHDRGAMNAHTIREPHGVVVGILPFNWPPIHAMGKTSPAIAAGNAIILKPGEQAPLTVMRLVEILQTVLPKDLVQAVPGNGPAVPQALVEHPDVRFVSFTGSTAVGKKVAETGARSLTRVATELGGKNAFVVFEDADIDAAARDALEGALFNKGEACTAASRILIHSSVHDAFVEKLSKAWLKVRIGDGMDPNTHVGPCVSKAQQQRALGYLDIAKKEGAKIAAQVPVPTDDRLKHGYYVPPTLLTSVTRDMRVAQEEIFAPVQTVCKFDTEAEAVAIVNESLYGLTAIAWTRDMERAMRLSRLFQAGMVFLNNYKRGFLGLPFGGVKDSGDHREHAIQTLDDYSTRKVVMYPSGFGKIPSWRAVDEVFDGKKGGALSALG